MKKRMYTLSFVLTLLLFFCISPNTSYGQFCCCPVCPECLPDSGGCGFTCAVFSVCGDASFAQSSTDPACLGTACNPAPVEMSYFEARNTDNGVQLSWGTASEIENKGFDIQRMSGIDMDWEVIGFVEGNGTTTDTRDYEYLDEAAPPGNNYYRLKQVDFNGTFVLSEIEASRVNAKEMFQIFPTIAKDYVFLGSTEITAVANSIEIFNLMGQKVMDGSFGYYTGGNIDISDLPTGQYIVYVTPLNKQPQTLRFVKVN